MTKHKLCWIIASIVLLTMMGLGEKRALAQTTEGSLYFPETGHWVSNEFLVHYQSVSNPEKLFGLPITDAFWDEATETDIQYFEKVRFELHPESPLDLRVQLTHLGAYLYSAGQTLPAQPNSPACHFFPENGYQVCYAFLDFFEANGGITQFGYPISNFEVHEGWIVQYFQRARFEWHPELATGQRVTLTNLGSRYFQTHHEDSELLRPNRNNIPQQSIMDLQIHAFAGISIMPPRGMQTLYVIVQDQNLNPVQNAMVNFEVKFPNGESISIQMDDSNQRGVSVKKFPINVQTQGIAEIIVNATYRTLQTQTKTSFQIWW